MFNKSFRSVGILLVVSLLVPIFSANAANGTYKYRFTKMGSGIRQTGEFSYDITGEKYKFATDESVFATTRIYNISKMGSFQFMYQVRGAMDKDFPSPVYRPNKSWWAEIWYWDEFGPLPAGDYTLNVLISTDNGQFKRIDTKRFSVNGSNYYGQVSDFSGLTTANSCDRPNYSFNDTETGKNVRSLGSYAYEVVNKTDSFNTNENVYVMAKTSHISGANSFRVKFDVYLDGQDYYKTNEPATLYPNCGVWAYNYTWANLGSLPRGTHEIRTYIKFNNGAYHQVDTAKISVKSPINSIYQPPVERTAPASRYSYSWTQTDNTVRYDGNYVYSTVNPRDTFTTNEDVRVLTKMSNIRNVNTFRIRHELHQNGKLVAKIESADRQPANSNWQYNFTESDFGRLSGGDYEIRVFISLDRGTWQYLDSKTISVVGGTSSDDYDYGYTVTGTSRDFQNYGYYNIAYPSYVTFPFSASQY